MILSRAWDLVQREGGRGGGHSGPDLLHNFPKIKNLTWAPSHLGRSSQGQKCGINAKFNPIGFTSGLEI